eukprot:TRINITY_DN60598_c0_g1_i1.p1 TRINITY_DN60598_c0_g1~~TRINITY_DN60598_c0_g1_i1.p1  ORF type:complete len:189 (-),score=48.74 TRINITY_DN60598_c0_g1_i1:296-862(-)
MLRSLVGSEMCIRDSPKQVSCWLIDCEGSALYPLVKTGSSYVCEGASPSSGKTEYPGDKQVKYIGRAEGSSISEGIGIDRKTANFATSVLDGAMQGTDREAVEMAYFLMRNEGLFVGPSAALNVVGAVKLARILGPNKTIVTVICDGGDRYRSKIFNPQWLEEHSLTPVHRGKGLEFVQPDNAVPAAE